MRTISSLPVVGDLLPPMKLSPLVGAGNIPAPKSAVALPLSNPLGMAFPGNGWNTGRVAPPCLWARVGMAQEPSELGVLNVVMPAEAKLAARAAESWPVHGT